MYSILNMIADVATTVLGGAFLLRFWIQITHTRPPLQLADLLLRLTDWFVKPLRRLIPGWRGYDWSTLIAAILAAIASALFDSWMIAYFSSKIILLLTLLCLLNWILYGLMGLLIIEVIFSWVNPYHPLASFARALNNPLLNPIRRFLPTLGSLDLSTLVAFLLLQIISKVAPQLILVNLI